MISDKAKEYIHEIIENPKIAFSSVELNSKEFKLPDRIASKLTRGMAFLGHSSQSIRDKEQEIIFYVKQQLHAKSYGS